MNRFAPLLLLVGCSGPTVLTTDAERSRDAPSVVDAWAVPSDSWTHRQDVAILAPDTGTERDAACAECSTDAGVPGDDVGTDAVPDAPVDASPVVDLALGDGFSCVLRSSGRVMCWGNPSFPGWPVPVFLDATEISSDMTYGYARRIDGTVWRWRGTGIDATTVASIPTPSAMPPPQYGPGESFPLETGDYVEVRGTTSNACGRRAGGSVWCWGSNHDSQLGRETDPWLTERGTLFPAGEVMIDGARMDAVSLAVAAHHRCVLLRDGRVMCWGSNSVGQLGHWVPGLESAVPVESDWYMN